MSSRRLILLLAAACGNGGAPPSNMDGAGAPDATSDASVADASLDASVLPPDANPDLVAITAYSRFGSGKPDPTAIAIFMNPAGATLWHGVVDDQGRAAYPLPDGGSVTVLQAATDPMNVSVRTALLSTIRDVEPGDQLRFGPPRDPAHRDIETPITRMHASYTPFANLADGPYLFAACPSSGGISNPRQLTFHASCVTPTFDLLAFGSNTSGASQYVLVPDIAHVPDGSITIPDAWQPMPQGTTTLVNVPANLTRVAVESSVVLDELPLELDFRTVERPSAGTHTLSQRHVPWTTLFSAFATEGIAVPDRQIVVTDTPSQVTIDFAALPVPRAQSTRQTSNGVTWTVAMAGEPDARVVTWWSDWTDGNNVHHVVAWELLERADAPAGTQLPALPAALSDDDPTFADPSRVEVRYTGSSVSFLDYDNLLDYDAARPHGTALRFVETMFAATPHRVHQTIVGT